MAAILVVILGALVAAVVLTTPRAGGPSAGRVVPLVGVPASQIGGVTVTDAEGHAVTVASDPAWSGWLVREERDEARQIAWPASETTRSAGVRVLANARVALGQKHHFVGNDTVLVSDLEGNQLAELYVFKEQVLGGRVPAILIPQNYGAVDRDLANFLSPESLLAWRDSAVLPALDASAVTISVDRSGDLLALRRVGAKWAVELPVNEPADAVKVQTLIDGLVAARSEGFIEDKPKSDIVTLMVDAGPSADRRRYTAVIDTGSLVADVMLFKIDGETTTEVARASVRVSAEFAALLDIDVTEIVSAQAIGTPASEVAALTLGWRDREIARRSSGWASAEDETTGKAWLDLLTQREASEVALSAGEAEGIGTIELRGFGDLAMGSVHVRAGGGMIWVARDRVWRGYPLTESDRQALALP